MGGNLQVMKRGLYNTVYHTPKGTFMLNHGNGSLERKIGYLKWVKIEDDEYENIKNLILEQQSRGLPSTHELIIFGLNG